MSRIELDLHKHKSIMYFAQGVSDICYIVTTFIISIISAFILDWIFKLPGITFTVFHEMGGNLESHSKINIVSSIIYMNFFCYSFLLENLKEDGKKVKISIMDINKNNIY